MSSKIKKKRAPTTADSSHQSVDTPSPVVSAPPNKRRRVSLACEACRAAREKCDGQRPTCGTCIANKRTCSYAPASKKRGVKTGYLRAIELSLAWMFDQIPQSEAALYHLLTHNNGRDGAKLLKKDDAAGLKLHKRWTKSQVHKELARLLSDGNTPPADTSTEDSDSERDGNLAEIPTINQLSGQHSLPQTTSPDITSTSSSMVPSRLRLPKQWRRLLDIHFSYTHCWFPLLDRNSLLSTASSYRPEGISYPSEPQRHLSSDHAELWAALALASFQDRASSVPYEDATMPPAAILSTARNLIPSLEEGAFEIPHLRATLLHSLVLLGRGKSWAAWLLVGNTSRAAMQIRSGIGPSMPWHSNSLSDIGLAMDRLMAGCFVLDTFLSLCVGQHPHLRGALADYSVTRGISEPREMVDVWKPVPGLTGHTKPDGTPPPHSDPLLAFHQLFEFSKVLNASMDASINPSVSVKVTPEKLAGSLDPHFRFCDSLMWSTPALPSAFLLQAAYLTCNVALVTSVRASLLSTVMEVVESCSAMLGAGSCPPLMVALLEFVQQRGRMEKMHETEGSRWDSTLGMLKSIWRDDGIDQGIRSSGPAPGAMAPVTGHALWHNPPSPPERMPGSDNERQAFSLGTASPSGTAMSMQDIGSSYGGGGGSGGAARAYPIITRYSAAEGLQALDYDAILDELGSAMDCTDGADMDPQFMTNLGFAPGYDLGDKCFRESLGLNDDVDTIIG
ncbi:hypothetical protein B0I35DRAFT_404769 [Stachybotrys elegans]|uniref:Zn(2)-C6 fungal-type domain-containing protein n=1 Tax=Stachybotrys elegans TaxID=80388 RepID=A0A8K0WYI9_9HYPO|nr:hypothetical protein B0I35DRAFT_404769 [Stachybotrys elegans]